MKRYLSSLGVCIAACALLSAPLATPSAAGAAISTRTLAPMHVTRPGVARPDTCNASKKEPIKSTGGKVALPPCNGTTGKVTYGPNNAPGGTTVTLLAAATNPAPSECGSASGETTVAYVLATGNGGGSITYQNTNKKSTLKNAALPHSATFTLYAYAFGLEQFHQSLGSPSAKGVLKFPSPLNGMTVPNGVTLCFELDTP